jgi:hypothetical protein
MSYPAVKLHHLYSLNLYEGLDIIFEDLEMLDYNVLKKTVETKLLGDIHLIPNILIINEESISFVGHKINDSTYFVSHTGGDVRTFSYTGKDILTAIQYLYQMYNNRTNKEEAYDDTWNPRAYRPDN